MSDPSPVEFYWRPGCFFCSSLEQKLTAQGIELSKRNIWEDPADAAFVRSVADGNETVPTVVVGGRAMVNPSPAQVVAAMGDQTTEPS